jgi:hypothetical protein
LALSLTSLLLLLDATSLTIVTVHLKPDPINSLFFHVFTINRTNMASEADVDATCSSNGRSIKVTRQRYLHATNERRNIVFASFSLDAHGASLLGGSQRFFSPNAWITFMSQATDKIKRLQNPLRQLRMDRPAISASGTHLPYTTSALNPIPWVGTRTNKATLTTSPSLWRMISPSDLHTLSTTDIIPEVRVALGVGVEVITNSTMLVQLPNGNDDLPADVDVLHFHGIRGSKFALDVVVSGFFGVSSPSSPYVGDAVLRRPSSTSTRRG